MVIQVFILLMAAVAGLVLGSFLNVCIARLPRGQSVVSPRSRCPGCKRSIEWQDNLPLISFLMLRGRCRHCGAAISWQYPAVEALTAAWFVLAMWQPAVLLAGAFQSDNVPDRMVQMTIHQGGLAVLGFLLIGLAFTDWQTHLLPDELTFGGIFAGLLFALTESFFLPEGTHDAALTPEEWFVLRRIAAAVGAWLLLYGIARLYKSIRHRRGMGLGDAKMLAMMGAFLGPAETVFALFAGVLAAALYGVALVMTRRGHGQTRIPFGTFLAFGGLLAAAEGQRVLSWYMGLFPR